MITLFLVSGMLLLSACGGGNKGGGNLAYDSNCFGLDGRMLPDDLAAKCCSGSTAIVTADGRAPDGCPAFNGSLGAPTRQGAVTTTQARVSLQNAQELAGDRGGNDFGKAQLLGMGTGGPGDGLGKDGKNSAVAGSSAGSDGASPFNAGNAAAGTDGGGTGGGAGAGGGGGGRGLGGAGGPTTDPADMGKKNKEVSGLFIDETGKYSEGDASGGGGGAGGSGGGGGGMFGNLFGGGGDGASRGGFGGAGTVSFGRGPSSDVPPIVSMDPDDYFSRIRADMNLFKIVEIRYQKKTLNWK